MEINELTMPTQLTLAHNSGMRFTTYHINEAAKIGRLDLIKCLHNLNARGTQDTMDHAVYNKDEEMIKYLLKCNYKPTIPARKWCNHNGLSHLFKPFSEN